VSDASSHPKAIVAAAVIGAVGVVIAAYIGLRKPSEQQIVTSDQYKALVHESATYMTRVQELTKEIQTLRAMQARSTSEQEQKLKLELSNLKEKLTDLEKQGLALRLERDSLSNQVEQMKVAGRETSGSTQPTSSRTDNSEAGSEMRQVSVDLKRLVGRWVGVAQCSRGEYPTSLEVGAASGAELSVKYSDSVNGGVQDGTLILLPSSSNVVTFAFRTKDDRFIAMKNGNRLVLSQSGLLVSPSDANKQCKIALSRS
jgi:hypothetical protein